MTPCHPLILQLARSALRTRGLEFSAAPITLGQITLLPHQIAAVHWLNQRINAHGGALLADPPGLGKTYVALAVASMRAMRPLVIAPASLRARWRDAARETNTELDFISTERLSAPAEPPVDRPVFVIVDEAHHFRTPSTRRHQRTASLCRSADVLLLSATPIHNRARDLEHITALFHLPATRTSAAVLRQRLTLHRSLLQIQSADGNAAAHCAIPRVRQRRDLRVPQRDSPLPHAILALPPLIDGAAEGHRLLQLGLLHALRSSDAAARERIRRRIAVTLAIEHAALAGVTPTPLVTRAFRAQLGDVQLAMPLLLGSSDAVIDPRLVDAAIRQRRALEGMLPLLTGNGDSARSHALRRLARWCTRPVVAFTQFNATASAFYHCLSDRPGIALLGGTTARITTGVIPRHEVIERLLAPRFRGRHDAVRLLITSDVLSEGLSLAGVATIVHLDLPWTAARIDQRTGRAARIGAPVSTVHVVRLPAPIPAHVHDALDQLVSRKRECMTLVDGEDNEDSALVNTLRAIADRPASTGSRATWLTMRSIRVATPVTIAIVQIDGRRILVAADATGVRRVSSRDWSALDDASIVEHQSGRISALRRALRVSQADRELTRTIADPRDQRFQARRSSDHLLARVDRASRAESARDATAARLLLMHSSRRGGNSTGAGAAVAQDGAMRIFAGVVIVPAESVE